jgi:hypothetical protein
MLLIPPSITAIKKTKQNKTKNQPLVQQSGGFGRKESSKYERLRFL